MAHNKGEALEFKSSFGWLYSEDGRYGAKGALYPENEGYNVRGYLPPGVFNSVAEMLEDFEIRQPLETDYKGADYSPYLTAKFGVHVKNKRQVKECLLQKASCCYVILQGTSEPWFLYNGNWTHFVCRANRTPGFEPFISLYIARYEPQIKGF